MMVGVSMLLNIPITTQNSFVWGVFGFIAVALAPSVGMPPELPGMPAADLYTRQIWWVVTILATSTALYMWLFAKNYWWQLSAFIIAIAPQLFAPINAAKSESNLPASLAAEFASSSLAANLVMWLAISYFVALALQKYQKDIAAL